MIPYANMAPFRQLGPPKGCEWVYLHPKQSTSALQRGDVVAAAAPVGDLPLLAGSVRELGPYGIAAHRDVESVLLFADRPVTELTPPTRLHLTNQSSTSVRLLYLVLGELLGFDRLPWRTADQGRANAELIIGDDALVRAERQPSAVIVDLAAAWYERQGLPFVFARWMARHDAPVSLHEAFTDWFERYAELEEELIHASAPAEAIRLGLSEAAMVRYLKGIIRILGPAELQGQERFLALLERHQRDPLFLEEGLVHGDRPQGHAAAH
jgi:predicted solute-binding protein